MSTNNLPNPMDIVLADAGVNSLLSILKLQDEETYEHSIQVATLVSLCIEEMINKNECEWYGEQIVEIIKGAILHDIGKAFLPFGIQNSKTQLDKYKAEIIKVHPILGYLVVKDSGYSTIVKDIILLHHKNADDSGYPINLENNETFVEGTIPNYVWVVAYADRFDAMTSKRNFKASKNYSEAWDELNNLRITGILPYKYAKYYHSVIKKLNIFS